MTISQALLVICHVIVGIGAFYMLISIRNVKRKNREAQKQAPHRVRGREDSF